MNHGPVTRRSFLAAGAALATATALGARPQAVRRLASINSVYWVRSHAYHIAGRFIHGYGIQGFHHQPAFKVARMFNDQYPANDLSRDLAKKKGIELTKTAGEALGGSGGLDVDGVLLIVEHGNYPTNERGQILYPRYKYFMEIVEVFRKNRRSVPVFVDKHFSYDHKQAAEMVAAARELRFPLMAGSSLPVTWRRPELEPPVGTPMTEALVCHAGGTEVYGFHGLETLQCMMERRAEKEAGVKAVRALQGPAVWKAGDDGLWSWELLEAALSRSPSRNIGDIRDNAVNPVAILVEYLDGAKAAVLNLPEHINDINFAARVRDRREPISANFYLPLPPGAKFFDPLCWNIEKFLATGKAPYPAERTLLTSTVLDFAMRSLQAKGERFEDPAMAVSYAAPADSGFFRGRYTDQ